MSRYFESIHNSIGRKWDSEQEKPYEPYKGPVRIVSQEELDLRVQLQQLQRKRALMLGQKSS